MVKRNTFRFGAVVGVLALAGMACTCGAISQVQGGVATAQALATQGNALVTQAQGFATQGVALATQVEQSGLLKTAEAAITEAATSGVFETLEASGTELGSVGTPEPGSTGVPDDMPVFQQNTQMQVIGNIITYQAETDLQTVTTFYQTELTKNGWEQAEDPIISSSATILTYKKGDRKATINMLSSGTDSVTIAIQIAQ